MTAIETDAGGGARERAFLGVSALVFLTSAAATISWSRSMAGGLPMPGGWTLSMAWMKMPGQTWLAAPAGFLGMWTVMMVAMMLPSLVPVLSSYRRSVRGREEIPVGRLTAVAGVGYFFVWAVYGGIAYALGVIVTGAELRWSALARLVPVATGVVLVLAGAFQLTAWKSRQIVRCWEALGSGWPSGPDARRSWHDGLRLGMRCSLCCSGFMVLLVVTGMMRLGTMALVAAAITLERLAPRPERVARAAGVVVLAAAGLVIVRALGAA
jgi:predicted metal-binding membrane protein